MPLWMMRRLALILLVACHSPATAPTAATTPPPTDQPAPTAPTAETAQAAYDAKQWDACGAQWMVIAKAPPPHRRLTTIYYNAASCYALGGKPDPAFAALEAASVAGLHNVGILEHDEDLAALHGDPRWPALIGRIQDRVAVWEKTLKDPALRRELLALFDEDQAARMAWIEQKKHDDNADWAPVAAIDQKTSAALKAAIAKHGWPGKTIVGEDGAHAAWLLVQHADADHELQRDVLARMQPMIATGEVTEIDYAYLYDRLAVAEKRKQRYGTQFDHGEPAPIEDEEHVDARREAIGLDSMAAYRLQMLKMYGPQKPAAPAK